MPKSELLAALKAYIVRDILDGKDIGLDADTPLLEWGIINSLEIIKLLNFIQTQLGVEIPSEKVTADFFQNLDSLTQLVLETQSTETLT